MSATDELRSMLDERGMKWWPDMYYKDTNTCWRIDGFEWRASERDGKLRIGGTYTKYLTPEQVVKVMVGRTCRIVKTWSDSDYDEDWRYRCSECGCPIPVDERDPETGDVISAANYCPNCGRRVVE
jgi:DNA-directed RNA polymerase subunit RPC12/RpoP